MARMLGASLAYKLCWCFDCRPSRSEQLPRKRRQRHRESNEVRSYVSRLWAEDWDCPEDSVYDTYVR